MGPGIKRVLLPLALTQISFVTQWKYAQWAVRSKEFRMLLHCGADNRAVYVPNRLMREHRVVQHLVYVGLLLRRFNVFRVSTARFLV